MRAHAILPNPESAEIALGAAPFRITEQTAIDVPDDARVLAIGRLLSAWIGVAAAPPPPRVEVVRGAPPPGHIALTLAAAPPAAGGDERATTPDRGPTA